MLMMVALWRSLVVWPQVLGLLFGPASIEVLLMRELLLSIVTHHYSSVEIEVAYADFGPQCCEIRE